MKPGSIVWVDFDPIVGHEQRGHRPALVVSEAMRAMSIVVPLTSAPPKMPAHHPMTGEKTSTALCDQVRAIDRRRITKQFGQASEADLLAVRTIIGRLIGLRV